MKTLSLLFLMAMLVPLTSCSEEDASIIEPVDVLTQEEIDGLLFMYEEEKMARDLYLFGLDSYGGNQFTNISASEQRHMDAVAEVLTQYAIDIPEDSGTGVFNNDEIQDLYDALLSRFKTSEAEAYLAAMLVEETDIADLRRFMNLTENESLIELYTHLECASGNHIRAFNKKVDKLGLTYEPQILSSEDVQELLEGEHAHCG